MKISTHRLKTIAAAARKRVADGVDDYETILLDVLKDIESCCTFPQQLKGFVLPVYRVAASEFQTLEHAIRGRQRTKRVARARHAVVLACREMGMTTMETGVAMDRDHSTIVHSLRTGEKLLAKDRAFAANYASMLRRLGIPG